MINCITGEVSFQSGLHIASQRRIEFPHRTQALSLPPWKRHVLANQASAHGVFEVEALSAEDERVQIVLLAHQHSFYEPSTPEDRDRRAFHDGVITKELAGQREFSWGEVFCRLDSSRNKDWLVVAYSRDAKVPSSGPEVLLHLLAHHKLPEVGG